MSRLDVMLRESKLRKTLAGISLARVEDECTHESCHQQECMSLS
jgi:hypothetical protein